jgi:glycosyltransferase involved in cell wall biosynthesis
MRILYLSSDFGVPVYGHKGASIHLRAMARAFTSLGHDVRILSPAAERTANHDFAVPVLPPLDLAAHAASLAALRQLDRGRGTLASGHGARVAQEVRNLLYNQALAEQAGTLAAFAPECIYERYALFGFGGLELARALAVPHLLEVNAPLCDEHARARGLHLGDVARAIERQVWCGTGALLAVSAPLGERAVRLGAPPERVHVLPNGVDAERFATAPGAGERARAALGLGAGPVIGFVGSLKGWHGTEVLLEAFTQLRGSFPNAALLVVGEGPSGEGLRRRSAELGIESSVRFTGAVEHGTIPNLLAAIDVAAAPYLPADDFYFSPIKVYEYMAAGRPVILDGLETGRSAAGRANLTIDEPGLHRWHV